MNSEDVELLISAVQSRPSLWDHRCKMYHNRMVVDSDWTEVAEITHLTKELAKSRWKNLRDHFRKGLKKSQGSPSFVSQWIYFERLMFLKDVLQSIKPSDGSSTDANPDLGFFGDFEEQDYQNSHESMPSPSEFKPSIFNVPKKKSISKRKWSDSFDMEKPYTEVENGKTCFVKDLKSEDEDDDLNFFKSLLPFVKRLPSIRKLMVRSEIQEIMVRELSELENREMEPGPIYDRHSTYD